MDILLLILLTIYIISCVLRIKLEKQQDELMDKTLDLCTRLIDERTKVVNILINSDLTKEHYAETIQKIKNELSIDSQSDR